jgi:diguanylate cyclase (GGDEF)-like protein
MKSSTASQVMRIVGAAVGLLAVTTVVIAVAVMVVMQNRLEAAISGILANTLDGRVRLLISLVEMRESQMLFISAQPELKRSARAIASGRELEAEAAAVKAVLQSFVEAGFSGLVYQDGSGRELARAGRISDKPLRSVRLATALESDLAWTDGFALVSRIELKDGEGPLGTVVAEQLLPIATLLMQPDANLGKSGETVLCFPKGEGMSCFPQRLNPRVFNLPLYGTDGKPFPMTHALWGETGLVSARDYREKDVIAAYGPVGVLGLGMVVKMDADELHAPAQAQLLKILAACVLLISIAAVVLRRFVQPMAEQLGRAEQDARLTHIRLNLALDASRVTVWETDARTGEIVLSEGWAELLDRAPGETRTTVAELAALVHPTEVDELQRRQLAVVRGEEDAYAVEHRVRAASGHWKWILSRGKVIERDPVSGRALRMMGTNLDITERKRGEIEIAHRANYDTLTGAASRVLFVDRVQRAIARIHRSGGYAALMYLDIDKFKEVNDSHGHAVGDALLKEFVARLANCVRATDSVGRLGGDEFAVLAGDLAKTGEAAGIADKILAAMRRPMRVDGHDLAVTTSIGVVVFNAQPGINFETLAKRADAALYEAKAAGRNTYRLAA